MDECIHPKKAVKYNPYNKVTQCHSCGETRTYEHGQIDIICYITRTWVRMNSYENEPVVKKLLKDLTALKKEIQLRKEYYQNETTNQETKGKPSRT